MESEERIASEGRSKADHLCVLVHGLWGNPKHMSYVASALRDKHSEDKLHILSAKTNSDSFTYDGVDLGGERLAQEIEDYIEDLEKNGTQIKKISIVGYSLGGLVARYTIGLLHSRGIFDRIEPINFTTFASPHLGVRTPVMGVRHHVWNILGSRTLSTSGRQLFTIDSFRNTDRPLLAVLADPGSIFILALARFKNRVLYANIINDRSAPYYTTAISTTDPFVNLDTININYLSRYHPNILDPADPVNPKPLESQPPLYTRIVGSGQTLLTRVPVFAMLFVLIPIGTVVFLINSGIQDLRSQRRIKLHEEGKGGVGLGSYRIPLMVENARGAVESAIENLSGRHGPEYLPATDDADPQQNGHAEKASLSSSAPDLEDAKSPGFPTLALTPEQFAMVHALDDVGFKKYRVHLHKVRHTHAAIIVRRTGKNYDEGKVVLHHWLDEEFEI